MDKIGNLRFWTYFRRGHGTYLGRILNYANFIVLQYRLFIEYVPSLQAIFQSLFWFALIFFLAYVPVTIVIGYYDYKKFAVPVDNILSAKANPYYKAMASAIYHIAEGEPEKAKEVLRPWM